MCGEAGGEKTNKGATAVRAGRNPAMSRIFDSGSEYAGAGWGCEWCSHVMEKKFRGEAGDQKINKTSTAANPQTWSAYPKGRKHNNSNNNSNTNNNNNNNNEAIDPPSIQ